MMPPTVSIILPTYNRAAFLPQAFGSITSQTFADWELIVVDDGSTDETPALVERFVPPAGQPVRSIRQPNGGAYAARNTGLDAAGGRYVAFFDSDDVWLPHHLRDCVEALDADPGVDWVYGACRVVDHATGKEMAPSTFYVNGRPRPFLRLTTRPLGRMRVIEDERALSCMILYGTYNGLQNSVIRRSFFDEFRFEAAGRNEAEDQLVVVRALATGHRIGYFDAVHVVYRVHGENSSAAANDGSLARRRSLLHLETFGYERERPALPLTAAAAAAYRRRLLSQHFWKLGYALYWEHGCREEAIEYFRRGLAEWPWSVGCWKTYVLALARTRPAKAVSRATAAMRQAWWFVSDPAWRAAFRANARRVRDFRRTQRAVVEGIVRQHGDVVMQGPFKGLRYPTARQSSSYCAQILLGTYELELSSIINQICDSAYRAIAVVGAAEGYYVAGLAMRNPSAYVLGFEMSTAKHAGAIELLQANGLRNAEVRGYCGTEDLRCHLTRYRRTLLVVDIDGGEAELLDPSRVRELGQADVLVETHDMLCPGITETLIQRFAGTHDITCVTTRPRSLSDLPGGVSLDEPAALGAMDEFRGGLQKWLWMTAKTRHG